MRQAQMCYGLQHDRGSSRKQTFDVQKVWMLLHLPMWRLYCAFILLLRKCPAPWTCWSPPFSYERYAIPWIRWIQPRKTIWTMHDSHSGIRKQCDAGDCTMIMCFHMKLNLKWYAQAFCGYPKSHDTHMFMKTLHRIFEAMANVSEVLAIPAITASVFEELWTIWLFVLAAESSARVSSSTKLGGREVDGCLEALLRDHVSRDMN